MSNIVYVSPFKPDMVKAKKIACKAINLDEQQIAAVKEVASRYAK